MAQPLAKSRLDRNPPPRDDHPDLAHAPMLRVALLTQQYAPKHGLTGLPRANDCHTARRCSALTATRVRAPINSIST